MENTNQSPITSGPNLVHSTKRQIPATDFEQLASELLETGNKLRFRAHGRSMSPFVKDGDTITITPTDPDALKKGDIAFYRKTDGKPVAHRILGKSTKDNNTFFLIRGDGYVGGKEEIPAENITGIITLIERNNIKINPNNSPRKTAAAIWSRIQSFRWLLYRIKRRLHN